MYEINKTKRKIKNLIHNLEYYKKVYPRSNTVKELENKIKYYNLKLASLIG